MPKRKRDEQSTLEPRLVNFEGGLFRALKEAKGFERQRQSKRLRDKSTPPDKKRRIEKEILVLKSLDLHQAAHAHLTSALLRVKPIAENADKLPQRWREVVPKPDLEEEERVALHNVTSSLSNRPQVRDVVEKAAAGVCATLGVEAPPKKGKAKRVNSTRGDKEKAESAEPDIRTQDASRNSSESGVIWEDGEDEWQGFSDDYDNQDSEELTAEEEALAEFEGRIADAESEDLIVPSDKDGSSDEDEESGTVEAEEEALARYEDMLAGPESDDDAGYNTFMKLAEKYRGKEKVNYDDISDSEHSQVSISRSESEQNSDSGPESNNNGFFEEPLSPPYKKSKSDQTMPKALPGALPTLMGGYVSGSESEASEIDVAPAMRKNRRGQRARQQIWEKKHGQRAKHVLKEQEKAINDRNKGWDPRRGAVEEGSGRGVWKDGKRPFDRKNANKTDGASASGGNAIEVKPREPKKDIKKRDDVGKLHPSWEAKKLAKEKQAQVAFQGKKIVFD
ncbi:hypothetical protein MKZ38_001491 [Zalerion maritima]|uniref:Bud22 domain-containing protein n=1 Tax=Zalerion maritima TaxID=339359 RepID=A0AAD5RXK3_9PEZI|nr:hypothetical protein MKZ38_001491 [Zalerion maritima]